MHAFVHSVKSFVELVKYILQIPGVKFFLSERISQDPLENFFGCQRQRGRAGENPNAFQFCKNTQALRIINSVCGNISKGNCRGRKQQIDMQDTKPLPKRRRNRKKTLAKENDYKGSSLLHPETVDTPLAQSAPDDSLLPHPINVDCAPVQPLVVDSSPARPLDVDCSLVRPLAVVSSPAHPVNVDCSVKSQSKQNHTCLKAVKQFLDQASGHSYFIKEEESVPRQSTSYDCGVFVCLYARCLAEGLVLNFSQRDIPTSRNKIVNELLHNTLL